MFCICKYSEGINTKLYLHIKQSIDLEKDLFYHGYINLISVGFLFPCIGKVYQYETTPALQDQV